MGVVRRSLRLGGPFSAARLGELGVVAPSCPEFVERERVWPPRPMRAGDR